MRFFHLALLPLAAATLSTDLLGTSPSSGASTGSGSGLKVITDAITSCTAQVKVCSTAVSNLKAGSDFKEVEKAFGTLITTIETAGKSLKNAGEIEVGDLLSLIPQLQPLSTGCVALIGDLVAKKTIIAQLSGCTIVLDIGNKVSKAVQTVLEGFGALVPQLNQAQGLIEAFSSIVGSFQNGVLSYSKGNCTNGGSGSDHSSPPTKTGAMSSATSTVRTPTGGNGGAVTVTVTKTVNGACECSSKPTTTSKAVSSSTFVPPPPPVTTSRPPPTNGTVPRPSTSVITAGAPMFTAQAGIIGAIALVAAGVYA